MILLTEYVILKRTYVEQLNNIVHKGTPDNKDHFILAVQIAIEAGSTHTELADALGTERVNVARWANGQGASSLLGRRSAWPILIREIEMRLKALRDQELPTGSNPQPHVPFRAVRKGPNTERQP